MEQFTDLPPRIQKHLRGITESSGLPPGEDSLQLLTRNWIEKRQLFSAQIASLDMIELPEVAANDPRAVLLLTWSGSLISLETPDADGGRGFEYASIKLRHDVPGLTTAAGVEIDGNLTVDQVAVFSGAPISRSSEILHIASFPPDLAASEQNRRLREAVLFLTNGFAKLNRALTQVSSELDHFTTQNMVQFIAKRRGLTQAQTREIINDYVAMVRAGMLMGERVPVGSLGRAFLQQQAARKPYMGRNPATGEDLLIPAKPPTMVPKFSYSSAVKSAAERIHVPEEDASEDTTI
ncbi:HU family DNA-binding protein [Spirochaeta africana]|uniref:Bacterial nucleoid DNA-binding protein n=1 Tax=Spirochaeta africana (strain ATCC 700263 / DSM 8902 / Z-7692) TaxID=889378 RepID=H9UFH4_SPIAZ|nr:HU family DNA-binding protein [Spirochaeta africana]AFG36267.1 bacterial nucleoid DNA-binding protein [Spirochaeta africana DSM 8902]